MSWRETTKKPAAPKPVFESHDDDWETDVTYQNDSTEKSQRYGSASVPGSGRKDHIDLTQIHDKMKMADATTKSSYQEKNPNRGYGGKYGTEQVMDKAAVDFSYKAEISKHSSQTVNKKGSGEIPEADKNVQDKSTIEHKAKVQPEADASQTDAAKKSDVKVKMNIQEQDKSSTEPKRSESSTKTTSGTDKVTVSEIKSKPSNDVKIGSTSNPTTQLETEKPSTSPGPRKISNLLQKFENIKKEKDEETVKRIAALRSERFTNEDHLKLNETKRDPPKFQSKYGKPSGTTPTLSQAPVKPMENQESLQQKEVEPVKAEENISSVPNGEENKADEASTENLKRMLDQESVSIETSSNEDEGEFILPQDETDVQARTESLIENKSENTDDPSTLQKQLRCVARHSYQQSEDDELSFKQDDIISDVEKTSDLWWHGTIGSRSGTFPANYVEEIQD